MPSNRSESDDALEPNCYKEMIILCSHACAVSRQATVKFTNCLMLCKIIPRLCPRKIKNNKKNSSYCKWIACSFDLSSQQERRAEFPADKTPQNASSRLHSLQRGVGIIALLYLIPFDLQTPTHLLRTCTLWFPMSSKMVSGTQRIVTIISNSHSKSVIL